MSDTPAPVCAEDYLELAQQRLPPDVAAYLFGGAEAELAARRNREALDAATLIPRFVRDTPFTPPGGHAQSALARPRQKHVVFFLRGAPA